MDNIQNESNVKLELNVNQVNIILGALRELPHRVVNDLINEVISQAQSQISNKKQ